MFKQFLVWMWLRERDKSSQAVKTTQHFPVAIFQWVSKLPNIWKWIHQVTIKRYLTNKISLWLGELLNYQLASDTNKEKLCYHQHQPISPSVAAVYHLCVVFTCDTVIVCLGWKDLGWWYVNCTQLSNSQVLLLASKRQVHEHVPVLNL
jgi:hypothetical protein